MKFELLVAIRYLRAKRKQAVISLITFISIIGVGAGVAALIIGPSVRPAFASSAPETHYSLLRTIEAAWGLTPLTAQDGPIKR